MEGYGSATSDCSRLQTLQESGWFQNLGDLGIWHSGGRGLHPPLMTSIDKQVMQKT